MPGQLPPARPAPRVTTTRRAALGGAGLALLAGFSGCDDERTGAGSGPGVSTPGTAADGRVTGAGTSPDGSPDSSTHNGDSDLVHRVVTDVRDLEALVVATAGRHRGLRASMRPLRDLHRAHLDALDAAGPVRPAGGGTTTVPGREAAALQRVRAQEQRLQRRLVEAALDASSGTLARLLACMSAGVTQQLVSLTGKDGGASS